MCLDTVGRVVDSGAGVAHVAFDGTLRTISLVLLEADGIAVQPGDWLLSHTGLATQRLDPTVAEAMIAQVAAMRESEVDS